MRIYHYSQETGEFTVEGLAELDPVGGKPMIPAYAVEIEPPETGENEVAVFSNGKWVKVPDYRGYKGYDHNGFEHEITSIGDIPDSSWLEEMPLLAVNVVSMRQARLALLEKGYLSQVEPIIDQLPEEQKQAALIEWEFAGTVDREKQLTRFLVAGLNLTEQEENELFELAATL